MHPALLEHDPFEREHAALEQVRAQLVKDHLGQFVVFKGEQFLGAFEKMGEAYKAGMSTGSQEFLVERLTAAPVELVVSSIFNIA